VFSRDRIDPHNGGIPSRGLLKLLGYEIKAALSRGPDENTSGNCGSSLGAGDAFPGGLLI